MKAFNSVYFLVAVILVLIINSKALSQAQTIKIGDKEFELISISSKSEAESLENNSQRRRGIRRFGIYSFFIYPQLSNLPSGDKIYLRQIQEAIKDPETKLERLSQSLDRLNEFLEGFDTSTTTYFFVGKSAPRRYSHGSRNVPKFGYRYQSDGIQVRLSPLGHNNKKTRIDRGSRHIGYSNIQPGTEVEISLYIAQIEESRWDPTFGYTQRLVSMQKLDTTKIVIREGVNFEITIHLMDHDWFLEATEIN